MFEIIKRIRKVKGAGYSEIMLVLSLISMISVASFKTFGNTAQHQVSGIATELSGQTYDSAPLNTITQTVQQQSNSSNRSHSNSAVLGNGQVSTANTSTQESDSRVLVSVESTESVARQESDLASDEQQASQDTSTHNTSQSTTSNANPADQSTVATIINNLDEFRAGFVEGAESQANELIQIILHPIETAKGIIKLVDLLMENPQQVLDAMIEELGQNAKDILSGDPRKLGKVIGENLSPAAMLKVVAKASKAVASLLKKEYTPSCCCFAKGTPVSTPEGFKAIDQLRIGDLVQSKNELTGEMQSKPVSQLFLTKGKQLYALTTLNSNGLQETVEVTDNHPYWVEGEWIESAKLQQGMVLTDEAGQKVVVVALQELGKTQDTYNIEVADFHTYFVGESKVLVHNECACKLSEGNYIPAPVIPPFLGTTINRKSLLV
ncbi:MAG TPA: hypothetical protein DDW29_02055 [Gammaproteobacteria bacterium]|nr:hypothetical protein [Gammaproteobacteria bacterium]|tara:strand:- start:14 stop:1324 length:1311 start_codon:yes stop_codon:yes gene_type:complete